jgi:hypothetical protein
MGARARVSARRKYSYPQRVSAIMPTGGISQRQKLMRQLFLRFAMLALSVCVVYSLYDIATTIKGSDPVGEAPCPVACRGP